MSKEDNSKSKEKRVEEKEKLDAELERNLAVIKVKKAHKQIEDRLALTMRVPRRPNVDAISIPNPEKLVVAIYLFALAFPLLVAASYAALTKFPVLGPTIFQSHPVIQFVEYAFFLPFFITYLPFVIAPYTGSPPAIHLPLPEPLGALVFFGSLALTLFYPIACYFLWYKYRVAWILSFTASVVTIGLETYGASLKVPGAIAFWVFGVAVNFLILYLLWRCKSKFFNRG